MYISNMFYVIILNRKGTLLEKKFPDLLIALPLSHYIGNIRGYLEKDETERLPEDLSENL
jgi:hypothetical protein